MIPYPLGVAPSQRFRFEQYVPLLKERGYEADFFPFIDQELNSLLYSKGYFLKKAFYLSLAFFKRFADVFRIRKYDAVFLAREACFLGPPVFEYLILKVFKMKMIFDFDDAIWLPNYSEANRMWSWLKFPQKTNFFLKNASAVIAGNKYLAEYARRYNSNVHIIPTTIDTGYHANEKVHVKKDRIVIGWTGSDTTIKYLEREKEMVFSMLEKYPDILEFRVISNKPSALQHPRITFVPWSMKTEVEDLAAFDIGIMPLPDDEWAKGKCGFKGLQYMSLGIPAVVSPVGVNTEIIQHGKNGFFAGTPQEWCSVLSQLIEDELLRERMGAEGKKTIEDFYSVNSQKEKYLKIVEEVVMQL